MSITFWDERYSGEKLAYGEEPNGFLVEVTDRLPGTGRALDLAAGEGRNALYLASLGLDVLAVDQSVVGLNKAQQLAIERGLKLDIRAMDLAHFEADAGSLDVINSIFAHLPKPVRSRIYRHAYRWLKPGGVFVLEAYAPDQIQLGTGGPKDPQLLASLDEIVDDLEGMQIEHRLAVRREVCEGLYHTGEASVVQVLARRP